MRGGGTVVRPLLADGSLELAAADAVWPRVRPWLPRAPHAAAEEGARARISVAAGDRGFPLPTGDPVIRLRSVSGWATGEGAILLDAGEAGLSGVVEPDALRSRLHFADRAAPGEADRVEVFAILTLAAAFLLGRLRRTLVHAAAVVAPDQRAWLLVGGTFSGKTTTCVNLIRQGWDYLSDDHVVMEARPDGPWIEGWPRRFNLDRGYHAGRSEGVRGRVDPEGFGPGRWRRGAALGGVLLPRVLADRPTAVVRATARDALHGLLQQSPWLLGDPRTAPGVLELLTSAARLPAYALELGADCYADGARLAELLSGTLGWHRGA